MDPGEEARMREAVFRPATPVPENSSCSVEALFS